MPGDASSKRSSERNRGTRSSSDRERGDDRPRRRTRDELLTEPEPFRAPNAEPGFADEMIARHGTAVRALEILGAENAGYRQRHRRDTETIEDLQDEVRANEVPDGGKVLTKEEAAEYDAFVALAPGVKAADLKTRLEAGDKAVLTLAEREANDHISTVAKAAGYNPEVLTRLANQDKLILTVSEQTVDGEKVPVAMVATKQGETPIALSEYAEKHYKMFLPALEASAEDDGSESRSTTRVLSTQSRDQGTRTSTSTQKSRGGAGAGIRQYREQHYGTSDKDKAKSDTTGNSK